MLKTDLTVRWPCLCCVQTVNINTQGSVLYVKGRPNSKMALSVLCADCEECNQEHPGECPVHGALLVVEDTPVSTDAYCFFYY